jgi:diacylglycerol kinase family enzyme
MHDRIAVITNSRSRQNRKNPGLANALQRELGPGDVLEVTHSFDDLDAAIHRMSALGVGYLGINGGDGTNHLTLSAMVRHWQGSWPTIVFLRGGTMNTVSNGFGGKGDAVSILRRVRRMRDEGRTITRIPRRLMHIRESGREHYGFIFGTGVVYSFLEEYYRGGDVTPVTAATTLGRLISSVVVGGPLYKQLTARVRHRVEVEGETWREGDFVGVLAATQAQIGLGFRPFHRADESPDRFPLLALDSQVIQIVRSLGKVRAGITPTIEGWNERVVTSFTLHGEGLQKYVVDGELYTCESPIEVSTGPLLQVAAI